MRTTGCTRSISKRPSRSKNTSRRCFRGRKGTVSAADGRRCCRSSGDTPLNPTTRIEPRTLKGFRDYLPSSMIRANGSSASPRRSVYRSYGFSPIDTPALEYLEILTGKGGEETDKQLYRFQDPGKHWVGMRFDLTVPLARFVAQHAAELGMPYKRHAHRHRVARREYTARPLSRVHAMRLRHDRHPRRRGRHRDRARDARSVVRDWLRAISYSRQ